MLPAAIDGRDSIELGCGTGYVSAWLARHGARPVGIDNSARQLETSIFTILSGPDDETIPAGDRLLRPLFLCQEVWRARKRG